MIANTLPPCRRLALGLALLVGLSACATGGGPGERPRVSASDGPVATGPTEDDIRRDSDAITARRQEAARRVPAPPPPVADDMADLNPAAVTALLGEPSFVRRDPPAEIWQYRPKGCVLDLFLYPQGAGGDLRVRHVAARVAGGGKVSVATCAARVINAEAQQG